MFSGRFDTKLSEDGSYFIDRDGTHFRYILNHLRTGQFIVPKDKTIRKELLAEADFYQVEGISRRLTARPFQDSVILSSDQCRTLMDWLRETGAIADITMASDNLLYRASRDGWAASNFHSCCDNKGPTVTVIKSGNYIFGGYTEHEWKGKIRTSLCNKAKIGALSLSVSTSAHLVLLNKKDYINKLVTTTIPFISPLIQRRLIFHGMMVT